MNATKGKWFWGTNVRSWKAFIRCPLWRSTEFEQPTPTRLIQCGVVTTSLFRTMIVGEYCIDITAQRLTIDGDNFPSISRPIFIRIDIDARVRVKIYV